MLQCCFIGQTLPILYFTTENADSFNAIVQLTFKHVRTYSAFHTQLLLNMTLGKNQQSSCLAITFHLSAPPPKKKNQLGQTILNTSSQERCSFSLQELLIPYRFIVLPYLGTIGKFYSFWLSKCLRQMQTSYKNFLHNRQIQTSFTERCRNQNYKTSAKKSFWEKN